MRKEALILQLGAGIRLRVAGLPIAAMMRDSSAVAFGEVAAKHPKNHSSSGTDNHEKNPGCNSSREVRKEEDGNSRIHQNRQYGSRHALRHVFTPLLSGSRTLWQNHHACLTVCTDSGANPLLSGSAPAVLHILLDEIDLCQSF